ncbi:hypothetical protein [Williamsia herbipolensis]|uniref:hypothetical protein n=1 Tax=Williamsia herbipolensis TaxID=1603258 RepID=UPI000698CFB5|nr:hypothetical protein [Williamsia herbipolensis]
MAPTSPHPSISDHDIARVLYTATGVINPVLDAVEHWDAFGIKQMTFDPRPGDDSLLGTATRALQWFTDSSGVPGTRTREKWSVEQRTEWWVGRVGRLSTALVAYPGVFGVLADRLPVQDLLGFAHQAFIICAVQRVHGVHDRFDQTDQLIAVLCDRIIDSRVVLSQKPTGADARGVARVEKAVQVAADPHRDLTPMGLVRSVGSVVGLLRSITDVLSHRPSPKQPWRLLSALPVVGAVADYVGEQSALRRATEAAVASLRAPVRV